MSKISEFVTKSGLEDLSEISMLENFFADSEIVSELNEAEKNRKKRQLYLITIIPLVFFGLLYFYSLGIFSVETAKNSGIYRPSEWFDGIWFGIIAVLIIFYIIKSIFHSKIEGAIKKKILSKLSKKIDSTLEYDEAGLYSFDNIDELVEQKFLNTYENIDIVEDSLAFKLNKDGKMAIIQGYELETSKTTRDSKGRKSKTTTNHCYLLKVKIPSARIKLEKNMLIKTDEADSINGSLVYAFLGGIIGGVIGFFIGDFGIGILLIFVLGILSYFLRKKYINSKRVKLENIEFEKFFDVQCEDQIGSRMIITPAFMNRLVEFVKKSKYKYEFLFTPNCFYVKWNISGNYLEVNTWKNITENIGTFIEWYLEMKNIISLIVDMQILYLSKTEASFINNDDKIDYETSCLNIPNNKSNKLGFNYSFSKKIDLFKFK